MDRLGLPVLPFASPLPCLFFCSRVFFSCFALVFNAPPLRNDTYAGVLRGGGEKSTGRRGGEGGGVP